jgi:acyl dehydratase
MIDPDALVARPPLETHHSLTRRDTILYALGIGETGLDYVYEPRLQALPTMAVVLTYPGFFWREPGYGADWTQIVAGEQSVVLHRPLPCEGRFIGRTSFEGVEDKGPGKGALVRFSRRIEDEDGTLYAIEARTAFLRGNGGCGSAGAAIPRPTPVPEDREPDRVVTLATSPAQALLYRLSGDLNPLHIDPQAAHAAGFERPILHGLCTYGIVGRAILSALCDGAPERLRRLDARFSAPVYPGETIETRIWRDRQAGARFEAFAAERGARIISHGFAEIA